MVLGDGIAKLDTYESHAGGDAGLPTSVPRHDRGQVIICLMALSIIPARSVTARCAWRCRQIGVDFARHIMLDGGDDHRPSRRPVDSGAGSDIYMTMLIERCRRLVDGRDCGSMVRYGEGHRTRQDEYGGKFGHHRTAAARRKDASMPRIVPMASVMACKDRVQRVTSADCGHAGCQPEGVRPQDEVLAGRPCSVFSDGQQISEGRFITAGNASQLSDGAAALVVMQGAEAERRGHRPGDFAAPPLPAVILKKWASARCSPFPDFLTRMGFLSMTSTCGN